MKFIVNLLKIIVFVSLFILIKEFFDIVPINSLFFYKVIEIVFLFVISFIFSVFTDYNRSDLEDKLKINLKTALYFISVVIVLTLIKVIFYYNDLVIGLANLMILGGLGAIPFYRDNFIYSNDREEVNYVNIAYIVCFVILKIIFTIIILVLESKNVSNYYDFNTLFIIIYAVSVLIIRPVVLSVLIKGYVEYDGIEHPLFYSFKVGKSRTADIQIEDKELTKGTVFSLIYTKDKFMVKPSVDLQLNNLIIDNRKDVSDFDTIKYKNNYFTILIGKGAIIKRFFLLFVFMIFSILSAFSDNFNINILQDNSEVIFYNADYTDYPNIKAYSYLFNPIDSNKKDTKLNEEFMIIEKMRKVQIKSVNYKDNRLDIIFVLDVTGSMVDLKSMVDIYKRMSPGFNELVNNIKQTRSDLRIGFITFADKPEDMKVLQPTSNMTTAFTFFSNVNLIYSADNEVNSIDGLFKLKDINFNPKAQKVVIFIANGLPHVLGDGANKNKDYTNKSLEDIIKYINSSSYLLYVVSNERYDIYQTLVNKNRYKFFNLNKYDEYPDILRDIGKSLKNQISIIYQTGLMKSNYSNIKALNIQVYRNEEAKKANEKLNIINMKKTNIFESLFDFF